MFVWNRYRNALHLMDFYVLVGNYRYLTYEVPGAGALEPAPGAGPFFPGAGAEPPSNSCGSASLNVRITFFHPTAEQRSGGSGARGGSSGAVGAVERWERSGGSEVAVSGARQRSGNGGRRRGIESGWGTEG